MSPTQLGGWYSSDDGAGNGRANVQRWEEKVRHPAAYTSFPCWQFANLELSR